MKKILFDLLSVQPSNEAKFHGGGEYGKILYNELVKQLNLSTFLMDVFYDFNGFMDVDVSKANERYNIKIGDDDALNCLLRDRQYDVFITPLLINFRSLSVPNNVLLIGVSHGARLLFHIDRDVYFFYALCQSKLLNKAKMLIKFFTPREYLLFRQVSIYKKIAESAASSVIFTDSFYSKYTHHFLLPDSKTFSNVRVQDATLHHLWQFPSDEEDEKFLLKFSLQKRKYFLITMANRLEKNAVSAVKAVDRLFSMKRPETEGYSCLLCGVTDNFYGAYSRIIRNKNRFRLAGYLENNELECAYKNAYLYIYPSLAEGYGVPPVAAMRYGTPVACAANSSIVEVCGDAPLYFVATDIDEIVIRLMESFEPKIINAKLSVMKELVRLIATKHELTLRKLVYAILNDGAELPDALNHTD
jgi:glycosyltransferase involved in cell wall biosynthesis